MLGDRITAWLEERLDLWGLKYLIQWKVIFAIGAAMHVKWRGSIIGAAAFIMVGAPWIWTWAQPDESGMPMGYGVMEEGMPQSGRRVQSVETPIQFILHHKAELDLTAEQSAEIETIDARLQGLIESVRPRIQEIINELRTLVQADRVDLVKAEAKMREHAALEIQLSMETLRATESAKAVLRPEQFAKLKVLPLDDEGQDIRGPGRQRGI